MTGAAACCSDRAACRTPRSRFLAQNPDHEFMRRLVRALAGQQGSWSLVEAAASAA
jgi:hypothetical protein